jgi:hypothetical protein
MDDGRPVVGGRCCRPRGGERQVDQLVRVAAGRIDAVVASGEAGGFSDGGLLVEEEGARA